MRRTNQWGRNVVVVDMPGTDEEDTVIVADTDGTTYRVERSLGGATLTGTLNTGQVFRFRPANQGEVQRITTNNPVAVFHNTGLGGCEHDVAFVLPAEINAAAPRLGISFNVPPGTSAAQAFVVFPDTTVNAMSLRLDGATPTLLRNLVAPGPAGLRVQTFNLTTANHVVEMATDFQLGVVTAAGGTGLYAYYSPYRTPGCGNRAIDPGEACDDGNVSDGDGCSSSCRIEIGFMNCMGMDSRCVPTGRCAGTTCVSRCMSNADCNDSNACTNDSCNMTTGVCASAAVMAGTMCTLMGGAPGACGTNGMMMSVCLADGDRDGVPDLTDADDDNDGVTDVAEGGGRDASRDSDNDGVPDFRDRDFMGFVDANMNGVDDRVDVDGDGIPNHLDLDSDGDGIFDVVENGHAMLDANRDGRIDATTDADRDGLLAAVDSDDASAMVITPRTMPIDTDMDMRIDALDADDDGDGVPTASELGAGGAMTPRNTDGTAVPGVTTDTIPDYLDADDDGDGVPTASELGAGGFMMPRNSDATVPSGEGVADVVPDFLDSDDDGDGIPTRIENTLEMMGGPGDMDMIPAYLDLDSDGDSVPDRVEAGPTRSMPANSDPMAGMGDRPDFLDTDSDNDCVPDSDMREAGAARTDPAMPSAMINANCTDPMTPVCSPVLGRCTSDDDSDGDGIPNMVERRLGTDPMNPDSDMDGVPDGSEVGAGPAFMTRDTDGDMIIDALDPDDDGDGVPTRDELGMGGVMMPRNSDAMVAMGMGTSDMIPDYLDSDDDGDGIPTRVERTAEGMTDLDGDMIPAYLDLDSDGDSVSDSVEAGADRTMPANSDGMAGMGDRPDFLDTDSDNDCVLDRDMREAGAARTDPTMPSASADANCMDPTPVCDRAVGMCVRRMMADAGADAGGDASGDAGADGGEDGSVDAGVDTGLDTGADGGASGSDGAAADSGAMDASPPRIGVLSGDGACACRVPAAPSRGGERGAAAMALIAGLALARSARRKKG